MDWMATVAAELAADPMTNVNPLLAAGIGVLVFVVAMVAGSESDERRPGRHDKRGSLR